MINCQRMLNTFFQYVKIDSETKNEKAIGERIIQDLNELGYDAYTDEAGKKLNSNGNNIYCFIPGTNSSETMLFSAHMDTVTPGIGIEPYIDGEYIKSKGDTILGGDDKAGVVAILEALRTIKENNLPHRPMEIVFSICEEGGVNGVKEVEFPRLQAKNGIVLDSGGGPNHIITEAPGQTRIFASIIGKPAHAGACPEAGISAIQVAAEAVNNMNLLRIDSETTANIGTFKAVGPTNIVSPLAEIVAEARSRSVEKLNKQTNHMIDCLKHACEKYGAELQ
ncbi:MAG: family metallo-hydrolase, partial [Clostridiales bacterium]|nr:family metallo-hydrolase [Clostridiales bacterium]